MTTNSNPDRLEDLRAEYAQTGMVTSDGAVWLFSQVVVLREQVQRLRASSAVSVVPPATNQTELRRKFGEVLRRWGLLDEQIDQKAAEEFAVTDLLALLPPPVDRAAVIREAADEVDATPYPSGFTAGFDKGARWATTLLHHIADEVKSDRCPHGCDTSTCPCLACEADDEGPAVAPGAAAETVPGQVSLNRDQLAALLAHHADVLAAQLRTDPARDAWIAAERLDAHAAAMTDGEEPPDVAELLDNMLTFPMGQPAAVLPQPETQATPEAEPEFTEARAAFMQIGRTPSLEGLRAELRIEGQQLLVGRYCGASMGRMHDIPGHEHLLAVDPRLIFEYADTEQPAVVAQPEEA